MRRLRYLCRSTKRHYGLKVDLVLDYSPSLWMFLRGNEVLVSAERVLLSAKVFLTCRLFSLDLHFYILLNTNFNFSACEV